MRKQKPEDLRQIYNEEDMLKGNICRMCVTDDLEELNKMETFAIMRINRIKEINYKRLTEND